MAQSFLLFLSTTLLIESWCQLVYRWETQNFSKLQHRVCCNVNENKSHSTPCPDTLKKSKMIFKRLLWRHKTWASKKKKRSFPDVQPGKPQVQVNQQTSCLVWDGARSTCPHITPSWLNLWPCLPSDVAVLELIQGETLLPIESRACPGALVDFAWVTCPGFLVQTCSWV